jgi:hypothetical protein
MISNLFGVDFSEGNTSIMISGSTVTINGVSHTLPPHRSLSIRNNKVYVDGQVFSPEGPAKRKRGLSQFTKTYQLSNQQAWVLGNRFSISNVSHVKVQPSTDQWVTAEVILTVEAEKEEGAFDQFSYSSSNVDASKMNNMIDCEVKLKVPSRFLELKLRNIHNSIQVQDLSCPNALIQNDSQSGELDISHSTFRRLISKTASGGISIIGSEATDGTITLKSQSGDVHVKDTILNEELLINTMSGDIRLEGQTDKTDCTLKSMSGDIRLIGYKKEKVLDVAAKYDVNIGMLDVTTMSGDVYIEQSGTSGTVVRVTTMSGDLSGNGDDPVQFSTMSGSDSYRRLRKK